MANAAVDGEGRAAGLRGTSENNQSKHRLAGILIANGLLRHHKPRQRMTGGRKAETPRSPFQAHPDSTVGAISGYANGLYGRDQEPALWKLRRTWWRFLSALINRGTSAG